MIHFFQRTFPSANMVLVDGARPVLIDSGFGGDLAETERLLREAGAPPERLQLLVNTHYHCDHVGGNHGLQRRYGVRIAAHELDAALVNRRDRDACAAEWLAQPVEPYVVDRPLADGDEIALDGLTLRVIHTPGHTLGHIALYILEEEALVCGDAVHGDDVAWINVFREGVGAIDRALASLDRLARLPVRWACSGHGPAFGDAAAAIDRARRRYAKWIEEPEKVAWHACKRIFTYALMIRDGMGQEAIDAYLVESPWFHDYARHDFGLAPADLARPLIDELLRSGAAAWKDGRLVALAPHAPPPQGWPAGPSRPREWL